MSTWVLLSLEKLDNGFFCNTWRFLMILSFGIWPLCLHKQDQAFGIKRPLRQCPGRIWSHNLPVQVPASCKHCKYLQYNAMEIQHFSHSVSWYQYIILYHCISSISSDTFWHLQHPWQWPLGTMKGPRKPATCMMRGLLHKCTSCDIANSAENCWRFSLSLLSRSTCNGVYVIHSFMSFQLSLQTNQHLWAVPMCCLSGGCTTILTQTESVQHICMWLKGKQSLEYAYISIQPCPNMRVTIMHSCSFLCDAGRFDISFSDFDSQL